MRAWYLVAAAVVLMFTFNGFGSRAPDKPILKSHVATVNLAYVLKYWDKPNKLNEEMKALYEPFREKEKKLMKRREKVQKQISELPINADADRRVLTEELAELTTSIEKNMREARFTMTEQSGKQMVLLQGEIEDVTRKYAEENHLEVVLSYADAFTAEDLRNPALVERKLKTSQCQPLYLAPGCDITKEVVAELNRKAKAEKNKKAGLETTEGP